MLRTGIFNRQEAKNKDFTVMENLWKRNHLKHYGRYTPADKASCS
jgi:aspartyl/asparaginyl beta-hydroxylase (cupin superfamily)